MASSPAFRMPGSDDAPGLGVAQADDSAGCSYWMPDTLTARGLESPVPVVKPKVTKVLGNWYCCESSRFGTSLAALEKAMRDVVLEATRVMSTIRKGCTLQPITLYCTVASYWEPSAKFMLSTGFSRPCSAPSLARCTNELYVAVDVDESYTVLVKKPTEKEGFTPVCPPAVKIPEPAAGPMAAVPLAWKASTTALVLSADAVVLAVIWKRKRMVQAPM